MISKITRLFGRFKYDERGNASVEFVIVAPVFLALLAMSIELSFITMRHSLLERGLDVAVREIRLGTGTPGTHDEVKTLICDTAGFLRNCESDLRLEMKPTDMRAYNTLSSDILCTDKAEPVDPIEVDNNYVLGLPNQLMVLRACYRYDPIFPEWSLGSALAKDANGQASIVTMSAFVQEPL